MSESETPRSPDQVLSRLLGPSGPQLGCEECFAHLDRYVEFALCGSEPDRHIPGMRAHLEGCPACQEDYRSLKAFVESK